MPWPSRCSSSTITASASARRRRTDKTMKFYADVLGLAHDPGRPSIPTIPGYWMDVGGRAQIHLMGVNGQSKFAQGPGKDPSLPHVALAVPDIQEARKELDRLGASYWVSEGVVGPRSQQIFLHDPAGNMIELHEAGSCRGKATHRADVSGMRRRWRGSAPRRGTSSGAADSSSAGASGLAPPPTIGAGRTR